MKEGVIVRPEYCLQSIGKAILLGIAFALPLGAQDVHVELGKRSTAIPKVCESIVPAVIEEGKVDVRALVSEANCKGSGDVLVEYTYVMTLAKREKNKKGQVKEDTRVYEVYIPVLKIGTRARGVLLLTSHNGVPVPPDEMERERLQAGKRLEKAESDIEREAGAQPERATESATGMLPLGTYPRTGINRAAFGIGRGGAALDVRTFLKACELKLVRRVEVEGRETLIFSLTPRVDAQLGDKEKYIAQLGGMIWIDAQDRIVRRLAAWPLSEGGANSADSTSSAAPGEKPPAVYLEMTRLPEGVWLPKSSRINGADYPKLFDHVSYDSVISYSEYKRFSTETKGVEIEPPKSPRLQNY
jgi:hypothetical protein